MYNLDHDIKATIMTSSILKLIVVQWSTYSHNSKIQVLSIYNTYCLMKLSIHCELHSGTFRRDSADALIMKSLTDNLKLPSLFLLNSCRRLKCVIEIFKFNVRNNLYQHLGVEIRISNPIGCFIASKD